MLRVLISYRREETVAYAGRLNDRLTPAFGREQVFIDVDLLPPGVDFVDAIEGVLKSADVLVAVIGPRWTNVTDEHGQRRLKDPADFVRFEIATAFKEGIPVLPVLVGGAAMPPASALPDDIRKLARVNACVISDLRFHADTDRLIENLKLVPSRRDPESPAQATMGRLLPVGPGVYPAPASGFSRGREGKQPRCERAYANNCHLSSRQSNTSTLASCTGSVAWWTSTPRWPTSSTPISSAA